MAETSRGRVPLSISMDLDALQLLRLLTPGKRGLGYTIGELVRAEIIRREERKKFVEEMRQERRAAERLAVAERRA